MTAPKRPRGEAAKPAAAAPRSRYKSRGKILYSLIGLMLLSGLLPLLLTSVWLVRRNREALEASERLLQLDQTRSIAQQARLYLQSMHNQLEAIAKTFEIGSDPRAVRSRIATVTPEALLDFIEEDRVRAITVFDRDGRFVTAGYTLDDPAIEASLRESLLQGLQAQPWTSPPHVSEPLLDTVVIMSAPVRAFYGGEGAPPVEGVVSAMVSLKPIEEMVKQKGNDRRSVFVVDASGRLVTHSDPATLYSGVDLSNTAIVKAFQESRGQASGSENFELAQEGETRRFLGTYTPIGDLSSPLPFLRTLGWGAIVQAEEDAVFFSVREIVKDSVFIAVLAAVLSVVLAVVFAGRLSQPIGKLAESARRLASGDFSQNIDVTSGNEIGEFAETFNFMISEIRRFIERLRKAAEENKQMFMGAVTSLAAAIDAKDPYTAGHSERVAHYSATIAKILRFADEEVENIRIAALMHDVGKIGIQDSILGKAGPLTDEEFAVMKTHPTKGAAIMEHVPQLKSMIPGMKYHHENVDGTGYPDGLKGDQIPLIAKIVSVADTFDAMTTNRPYQKAMDITYVFTRMRSFIGKKFEKHLVEALITAYEEGLIRPNMKVDSVLKAAPPRPAPGVGHRELPAPQISKDAFASAPAPLPMPPLPPPVSAPFSSPPAPPPPPPRVAPAPPSSVRAEETHGVGPPPALMDRIR
ncbi:MAG: HD domain-containing phosphohydrolase [Vicinamibacteria bacterium]